MLSIDIERSALVARIRRWSIHEPTKVRMDEIEERSRMVSFAAIWDDDRKNPAYRSIYEHGELKMLLDLKETIETADVMVTYNGKSFDMKHIRTELDYVGLKLDREPTQQDLLLFERKMFKHDSNKLDYVAQRRLVGKKLDSGISHNDLLDRCKAKDKKALKMLRDYNIQDTMLNLDLRDRHIATGYNELRCA